MVRRDTSSKSTPCIRGPRISKRLYDMMIDSAVTKWPGHLLRNLEVFLGSYCRGVREVESSTNQDAWDLLLDLKYILLEGGYNVTSVSGFDNDPYPYRGEEILNFMQYLLVYHRRLYLFFQRVPFHKVPLYIHRRGLRPFVLWRLENRI